MLLSNLLLTCVAFDVPADLVQDFFFWVIFRLVWDRDGKGLSFLGDGSDGRFFIFGRNVLLSFAGGWSY